LIDFSEKMIDILNFKKTFFNGRFFELNFLLKKIEKILKKTFVRPMGPKIANKTTVELMSKL